MPKLKQWPISYTALKTIMAIQETIMHQGPSATHFTLAMLRGKNTFFKHLTFTMDVVGDAMAPTLNREALKDPTAISTLLVRSIENPSTRNIHQNDIITFFRPNVSPGDFNVMVRRVEAMPATPILTKSFNAQIVPPQHCWVTADNDRTELPAIQDSNVFGPVPFENIVGRVLYQAQNVNDHGPVKNSMQATILDQTILSAELDVEQLLQSVKRKRLKMQGEDF